MDSHGQAVDPGIAIQIEVDIEPPQETELSSQQLDRLGLPSHHVHYTAGVLHSNQPPVAELLAPSDIQVSYTVNQQQEVGGQEVPLKQKDNKKYMQIDSSEVQVIDDSDVVIDPPRALPSTANNGTPGLVDNIFEVEAFCNLDCGVDGVCDIQRQGEEWLKKCLCPMGRTGQFCETVIDVGSPQFSGLGYISLPTLQNAYSDLHLSVEFKPTAWTGILLLTGETDDMTGDYLALIIQDGYVELRLDCGTGPGVVRSQAQVHLNEWNHLSVFRHDWGVWIQLNGGRQEEGRSQGLFSRITFNQPVFVGGSGSTKNVKSFLGVDSGFHGCVRHLEINDKLYSLQPVVKGGDVQQGLDISSCDDGTCHSTPCHNGRCSTDDPPKCECPLGFTGNSCENSEDIKIPSFLGTSFLRHPGLGAQALIWLELELVIRPTAPEGLVLYNGDRNDGQGDFMSIFLNQGYLEFAFDLGNGIVIARSEKPLSMGDWHNVGVSRTGREATLTVDAQPSVTVLSSGAFTQLSLEQNLFLGGVPDYGILSVYLPISAAFNGCIQKVSVNGLPLQLSTGAISGTNIENCAHPCLQSPCGSAGQCRPTLDTFTCECPIGWTGWQCDRQMAEAIPTPSFKGQSFLYFNHQEIHKNLIGNSNSINLRVRVTSSHGLLLWAGGHDAAPTADFIMLGVDNGMVQLSYNLGSGEVVLQYNSTRIDDGLWHRVRATRMEQTASLMVDNGPVITGASPGKLRQLNSGAGLYLGGVEDLTYLAAKRYRTGLVGCIAEFSLGRMYNINMLHLATLGRNIDSCVDSNQ